MSTVFFSDPRRCGPSQDPVTCFSAVAKDPGPEKRSGNPLAIRQYA